MSLLAEEGHGAFGEFFVGDVFELLIEAPAVAPGVDDGGGAGAPELVFWFRECFDSGGEGFFKSGVAIIDFDGEEAGAHLAFGEGAGVVLWGFA